MSMAARVRATEPRLASRFAPHSCADEADRGVVDPMSQHYCGMIRWNRSALLRSPEGTHAVVLRAMARKTLRSLHSIAPDGVQTKLHGLRAIALLFGRASRAHYRRRSSNPDQRISGTARQDHEPTCTLPDVKRATLGMLPSAFTAQPLLTAIHRLASSIATTLCEYWPAAAGSDEVAAAA